MAEPLSLEADGWFDLVGHGPVAGFKGIPGLDPRPLLNQVVIIDGHRCYVRAVEVQGVNNPVGRPFGLLVRPEGQWDELAG